MDRVLQRAEFGSRGIQHFNAVFAEVYRELGAVALVNGINNHAGAEFDVAHVLAEGESGIILRFFRRLGGGAAAVKRVAALAAVLLCHQAA